MKKVIAVIVLTVAVIVAFISGMLVGKGNLAEPISNSMTGVYKADSGTTLVLYEDGTCQYPNYGENAKWRAKGNSVLITTETKSTVIKGVKVFLSDSLSDAEVRAMATNFNTIEKVKSTQYVSDHNEDERHIQILFDAPEGRNTYMEVYAEALVINGVKDIKDISETVVKTTEHEATIMEKGLVLNGCFYEKVSN